MSKRKVRKTNPIRAYQIGLPVRMMVEMTIQSTSLRKAMETAKDRVKGKYERALRPYIKRVA